MAYRSLCQIYPTCGLTEHLLTVSLTNFNRFKAEGGEDTSQECCGRRVPQEPQVLCTLTIKKNGKEGSKKIPNATLAGVAQWTACQPLNQRVTGLIPSLGHMPGLWARSPVGGTQEATTH